MFPLSLFHKDQTITTEAAAGDVPQGKQDQEKEAPFYALDTDLR